MADGTMTVCELVDRYLKIKTGVSQSTKAGYVTVQRILAKEPFGQKKIRSIKTSDAKLFLIKLQQEDGKSYSSIHTIRGVLRPAFHSQSDLVIFANTFHNGCLLRNRVKCSHLAYGTVEFVILVLYLTAP